MALCSTEKPVHGYAQVRAQGQLSHIEDSLSIAAQPGGEKGNCYAKNMYIMWSEAEQRRHRRQFTAVAQGNASKQTYFRGGWAALGHGQNSERARRRNGGAAVVHRQLLIDVCGVAVYRAFRDGESVGDFFGAEPLR